MPLSRLFALLFLLLPGAFQAQVTINEFLSSNNLINQDPDYQEFSDWVELYNYSSAAVDLSDWQLSDDADTPEKWLFPAGTTIPSHGFLLVWADGQDTGLHTNFKLSADGEKLILSNATGAQKDFFTFGPQLQNVSQGRQNDGTGLWGYFSTPTPGASNTSSVFYENYTPTVPHFTVAGGFFNGDITLDIQNLSSSGTVHYTTDGSTPNASSPIFGQPIPLTQTTVVKARIIAANRIYGPVATNSYFINEHFEQRGLAVLSLSGDPDQFFGVDSGILVQDYKPEWEIPVHLEFFENDGLAGFQHDAGASVGGENSWILPQKLLNISSRKQYGGGHIDYQIFPDDPRTRYEDLILRTSGNDWSNTLFRDVMMQHTAASTADLDIQHYRPVAAFINGKYYGIYNIREKQDKEYAELRQGIDPDSLDYIENDAEIKEGDAVAYQQMVDLLNAGVSSDAAFANLAKICDIQNFTDYIISQIVTANTSWGHNIALFRKRSPDARWRWFPHDYDRGFNTGEVGGTGMTWATATNGASWTNPAFGTLFLRKMLENEAFKTAFINRFSDHLLVTWNPQWVNRRIDYYANNIRNEVPYHVGKWAGTTSSYGNGISSVAFWQSEIDRLKTFAVQRNTFMFNDLSQFFAIPEAGNLTIQVSGPAHGKVRLREMPHLPEYPWVGKYLKNRPFTLTATANPGFQFVRWEKAIDSTAVLVAAGSTWKYRDAAVAPPSDWNTVGFDDGAWASGAAQLGYGDGDETTTLSYGADPNNKPLACYFRNQFNITNTAGVSQLKLRLLADDGAVAYLNGVEIWRTNMPSGAINFNTAAITAISGSGESTWTEQTIPANLLVQGNNVLAVEIHQSSANSSDLSFDFEVSSLISGAGEILSTNPLLETSLTGDDATVLRAVFIPSGNCSFLPDTVHQNLTLTTACSPYTAPGDVVVLPNVTLTVEPGVEVLFPEKANLWIHGDLQINGTNEQPVLFKSSTNGGIWGGILLKNTTSKSNMKYLTVENASAGSHRIYFPAAISAYHADMDLSNLTLTQVTDNPIYARFSDVTLTYSEIRSVGTGDGINIKQGKGRVENCHFFANGALFPDMDAVDFDGVADGVVRDNVIHDFRGDNCDGLDIGEQCQNLQIDGNFIYHCFDKGISVGQQSSATISNNLIAYTAIGIALKDRSPVNIDHCTIFGTQYGISAYEKNPGSLGGNGTITDCIVSNTAFRDFIADSLSTVNVSNCLSGGDTLTGTGNLTGDPLFALATQYNFHLQNGSPAIGSATAGGNMGLLTIPIYSGQPQVLISEIMYNDSLSATGEFLELYNPGTQTLDLSGYNLTEAILYTFPPGTLLDPGTYLVVAKTSANFPTNAPYPIHQWTEGKLADEGEKILLWDATGVLCDFVRYNNHTPWPEGDFLAGRSLELISNDLDNHFAHNWQPSSGVDGTPGTGILVNTQHLATNALEMAIYPNPAGDWAYIAIKNAPIAPFGLETYTLDGKTLSSKQVQ